MTKYEIKAELKRNKKVDRKEVDNLSVSDFNDLSLEFDLVSGWDENNNEIYYYEG